MTLTYTVKFDKTLDFYEIMTSRKYSLKFVF